MNKGEFADALTDVDDEFIAEYAPDMTQKKRKISKIIIPVAACLAAVITLSLLFIKPVPGVEPAPTQYPAGVAAEMIIPTQKPFEWERVYEDRFAVLKITKITEKTEWQYFRSADYYEFTDYAVVCACEIYFHQYLKEAENSYSEGFYERGYNYYDDISKDYMKKSAPTGYVYIPEEYISEFSEGETLLINAFSVWEYGVLRFSPYVDEECRPVYLRFYGDRLSYDRNAVKDEALNKLEQVNVCIDNAKAEEEPPEWSKWLPRYKLETGTEVDDACRFLSELRPAAVKYDLRQSEYRIRSERKYGMYYY